LQRCEEDVSDPIKYMHSWSASLNDRSTQSSLSVLIVFWSDDNIIKLQINEQIIVKILASLFLVPFFSTLGRAFLYDFWIFNNTFKNDSKITNKTRESALVGGLDYQIPIAQLKAQRDLKIDKDNTFLLKCWL